MSNAMMTLKRPTTGSLASFEVLVRKVKETFVRGRERVKKEMVRTYWQTGKYIHEHVLHHRERADYGAKVIARLARRIGSSKRTLQQTLRFYRTFPKIAHARAQLDWTHLRTLASIPDEKMRREFARRAAEGKWTSRQIAAEIKAGLRDPSRKGVHGISRPGGKSALALLTPKLGIPFTYQLIESKPAQANPGRLVVDQGFRVHRTEFAMRGKLKAGEIIESRKEKNGAYTVVSSKRDRTALYTYYGWVKHVVDADTQFVGIDLGFSNEIEQYLRLRGIDAPEIDTPAGKKAKAFVEKCLKHAPFIVLTSSRSDKFDRYLSDVFIPLTPESTVRPTAMESTVTLNGQTYLYLNNELLLRGLAVRMRL